MGTSVCPGAVVHQLDEVIENMLAMRGQTSTKRRKRFYVFNMSRMQAQPV
jgi:hypothetical protein